MLDTVSRSWHIVPVTLNLCRSSLYDILLNFEHLPVIVTGIKRILLVTHEIVSDSDQWPAVISCTGCVLCLVFFWFENDLLFTCYFIFKCNIYSHNEAKQSTRLVGSIVIALDRPSVCLSLNISETTYRFFLKLYMNLGGTKV